MTTSSPEILTELEAAKYLRLSTRSLYAMRQRGELKYIKVGTRVVRYRRSDLDALLESHAAESVTRAAVGRK